MSKKQYLGIKWGDGVYVVANGRKKKLDPRLDLLQASPSGFSWGVDQHGGSQLAFAILCDALGDENRARRYYMRFKRRALLGLPRDAGFTLTMEQIEKEIADIEGVEKEFARERQRVARESAPMMSDRGQGVVWDAEQPDRQK